MEIVSAVVGGVRTTCPLIARTLSIPCRAQGRPPIVANAGQIGLRSREATASLEPQLNALRQCPPARMRPSPLLGIAVALIALLPACTAQQIADRPQRPFVTPLPESTDEARFVSLFDGRTLKGWAGDPRYWRVEDGTIVGELTPETLLKDNNSFLVWQGGPVTNFDLRLQYRISPGGNSGINYRSEILSTPEWTMRGYQFDIGGSEQPTITGMNYDERGRHVLALAGQFASVAVEERGRHEAIIGAADRLESFDDAAFTNGLVREGWNDARIIARGDLLIHILNGHMISVVIDRDGTNRHDSGHIGVQVHVGGPMKVEFRNLRLLRLPA
jgi:hypothetical protein